MAYDYLIGSGFHRWSEGKYTPGQQEFLIDHTHQAVLLSGAYRSGKSEGMGRTAIRHALAFQDGKIGVFRAKLASLKKSTLETVLSLVHPSWVEDWSNSELILRLITGSKIYFLGCEFADRIGSIELTEAHLDEAHEISQESYSMIVGRLSGQLTPCPTNDPQVAEYQRQSKNLRRVYLACNPKSKTHWIYQEFVDPQTRKPGATCYTSNSIANPNLPPDYLLTQLTNNLRPGKATLESLRNEIIEIREGKKPSDGLHLQPLLTPIGQRNLLGLWVALEGRIYELDPEIHMTDSLPPEEPTERHVGVDHGFHHPRVLEISIYPDGRPIITRCWAGSSSSPFEVVDVLEKWNQDTPFTRAYLPHDQPGVFREAVKRLGSKVARAKTDVLSGIGVVQGFVNSPTKPLQFWKHAPGIDLAWSEMEGYQWKRDKDGNYLDEPVKEDDHYADCVRYSLYTAWIHRGKKSWEAPPKPIYTPFNNIGY